MRSTTIGLVTAVFACFALGVPAWGQPATGAGWTPSITVQGAGEVRAKPDMATFTVGVVNQAASAGEALKDNSEKGEALLRTLRQNGIADKDVQTSGFSVSPNYAYDQSGKAPPRIVGYTVTNQLTVKVHDLPALGGLLDKVVKAGASQIQGVSFSTSDPARYLEDARFKAIEDAKHQAAFYAAAVGATLQEPPSIREENVVRPQPMVFAREALAADAAASVPIATGQQTFSARVVVTYAIRE